MKSVRKALCSLALLGFSLNTPLHAEPVAPVTYEKGEYRIPLERLRGNPNPIDLRGSGARAQLPLPVPARVQVDAARMEMSYTNSIALQPRSLLAVSLDDNIFAQLPLRADQPSNMARIVFDPARLRSGYHQIGFHAAQHYTDKCEDGGAPGLFTQVNTRNSMLVMQTTPRHIPPSLARLDDIFDKRIWSEQQRVKLFNASKNLLDASALAAQGAALRLDFVPLHVQSIKPEPATEPRPGARFPGLPAGLGEDLILIGTRADLGKYLAPDLMVDITGAYLGVFAQDDDPTHAIILIAGLDEAQVRKAAQVFALNGLALPDRFDLLIDDLHLPQGFARMPGSASNTSVINENGWLSFANLDFATTTLRGRYPQPAELTFWAFSEMFEPRQRYLEVELNYAYGAGFDQKSALNIFLNGQFIQALHLNQVRGEQVWHAKVQVPIAQLMAGRNTLSFAPSVIGVGVGGECVPLFFDNLFVSIADDSRIALPPNNGFMRLPDLSLLSRTGLPYTRKIDGANSTLVLLGDDLATQSAALTLIGKIAQTNNAPLTGMQVHAQMPKDTPRGQNLLLVGQPAMLPESLKREVTSFLPKFRWQSLTVGAEQERVRATLESFFSHPTQGVMNQLKLAPVEATLSVASDLGRSTAAVQYQSKITGGSVTLFSAASAPQLQRGIERLTDFTTWGALNGDGMLWTADGEPIAFSFPSAHSFVGDIAPTTLWALILEDHPSLLIGLVLGIIFLTSVVTWALLRRRAQRRNLPL